MREPGFYWVKYCDKWVVAECTKWWPTISDGSYEHRWFIPGFKKGRRDNDMEAIDERRIVRDEPCKDAGINLEGAKLLVFKDHAEYEKFLKEHEKQFLKLID